MRNSNTKKILDYYLEYEIYNIANSSQIKINNKTSIIIKENDTQKEQNIYKSIEKLKEKKIESKIEKVLNKKVYNLKEVIDQIKKELNELSKEQSNQVQVVFRINSIIKENIKYKIEEKILNDFAEELCNIKASKEFWLYAHNISFINKVAKKLPIFILRCKLEEERIDIIETNINTETLNTILAIILNKEISDIILEYKEKISNYSKEIKTLSDGEDLTHIIDLYYYKLKDYVGISQNEIKNISNINAKYHMNEEYIISIDELADAGIKNIKEDIELLNKLVNYNDYIPNLLNKYLNGSTKKKDINEPKYESIYRGNYKSSFGVGQNQYRIINTIKDNDLIAIEGPPGTGKTSLLKEIIANKIVERADFILENWNKKWKTNNYFGTTYYNMDWYNNDENTIKSIVVSSKNSEAIENVGKEINKEIRYMFPAARKYNNPQKNIQQYKGIICLPLGRQENIQSFKKFMYQTYIPMLEKLKTKGYKNKIIEKIKQNYKNKCNQIKKYEELITNLNNCIKDSQKYFYGIDTTSEENKEENIVEIHKNFLNDKIKKQKKLDEVKNKEEDLIKQKREYEEKIKIIKKDIKNKEKEIKNSQQIMVNGKNNIRQLEMQKHYFDEISKNLFTKILNYKDYKENKSTNFNEQINTIEVSNKIEEKKISQYIKDISDLEKQENEFSAKYNTINEKCKKIENSYKTVTHEIKQMELIEQFNKQDKNTYWHYSNFMEIYGESSLNDLNQELFELALKLNEAYIIKNAEEIIENLKLFLSNEENVTYTCQKFYDSTEIYDDKKIKGIKSIWDTIFLCFPVVTTTLDSFCKKYFHLIPEYIDLELIDEAGQILPHNFVSAAYRAKKAVIVGDVNQIEPIYNNVNKNFNKNRENIGEQFENIKVETNSIQEIASKHTDIMNNNDNIILNDHYRCEKNIINFSNENVYSNKLNMHTKDKKDKPFLNNMIALDVRGKKDLNENFNQLEIESCIETVKYIKQKNSEKVSIAIITPFKKQKEEISDRLDKQGIKDVKVGTVHAFQGQEKDYIIFSPVIDSTEKRWAVDFIGKKCNMLNVAVTRAKKQFIYLGNLNVALQTENYIAKLIKYIKENGLIYSLYDTEDTAIQNNLDEEILKILQPELELKNDNIGLYIKQNIKNGIMTDAKQHYEFLKYIIKNANKEICIMSPWIRKNVMDEEFIKDIKKLKEKKCKIKIVFGYKKGNKKISNAKELGEELKKTNSLGYSTKEEIEKIAEEMYKIIGKENFMYNPPTHAKILIIDDRYMCIGSHNWLSNAGKTEEQKRAKEGTKITTSKNAIYYAKEKFF